MNKAIKTTNQEKKLSSGLSIAAMLFLLSTAVIFLVEPRKEWMKYQRDYYSRNGDISDARVRTITITPTLTGKPEMCLTCHLGIEEISPSHPVESFGCIVCHGGNGQTLDKDLAHQSMRGGRNPSGLNVARTSCGTGPDGKQCHNGFSEEWRNTVDRVERSLQATYAGAIATVQYTYIIPKPPATRYGVKQVTDDHVMNSGFPWELTGIHEKIENDAMSGIVHPVEQKFVTSCIDGGCHLHSKAPAKNYFHRSQGCAACHTPRTRDGLYTGKDATISQKEAGHMKLHTITTAIPYSTCNACHNRGIYSMKQMQFIDRNDLEPDSMVSLSPDDLRGKEYYNPGTRFVKCELTLDCVDCHTHNEIMGNGDIFPDKKAAVETQCLDCHGTIEAEPAFEIITSPDQRDVFIAGTNPYIRTEPGAIVAVTKKGTLRPSVKKVNGRWQQISKVDGKLFYIPIVKGASCGQNVGEQESRHCQKCHDISEQPDA